MERPKNVIWITTDHMRFDCINAHGNSAMYTPNLDYLAENGVTFTNCYANNPLCMPSRCSFMTGCYPQQTGVMENGQELPADFSPTVAQCFSNAGYRTVQIGKLHFQNHEDHDLDPRARNSYGFDVFQLSEEPGCYEDAYRTWLRGERPDLVDTFTVPRPMSPARHTERTNFNVIDAPWEYSHSGWVAEQTCRYLYAWGARREPQFIHMGFYAPHPPLNPTKEMFAHYDGADLPPLLRKEGDPRDPGDLGSETLMEYRRHFYAMVTGVDMGIGKLIQYLKEQDQFEDTLIIFSSDHGDACGDHGRIAKGPTYLESIMKMPFIIHWPKGLDRPGKAVNGLTELIDIMPTILDLCNIPQPAQMQGRSYGKELLADEEPQTRNDAYAVHGNGMVMLRTEHFKYLRYPQGEGAREELYDLREDPGEFDNIVDVIEDREVLIRMRDRAFTRTLDASKSIRPCRLKF